MTTTALAATVFAAKDLRVTEVLLGPVPADRVRLPFRAGGICGSDLHYSCPQDGICGSDLHYCLHGQIFAEA